MAKVQYSGIKYPFESQDVEKYFVDLNKTMRDSVRSQLMHVIFTPKGQKIRDPEFGTRLIHEIFEPSDNTTWSSIIAEVSEAVSNYVKNVKVNDINVLKSEDNFSEVYVRIDYSVKDGNITTDDTVITKI